MSGFGPIIATIFASMLFCGVSAAAETNVSEAQWIVAETDDEVIHYATFCGFFELRTLLHNALKNGSVPGNGMSDQTLTFHVIGKNGVSRIAIGPEWISIEDNVTVLDHESYSNILALVKKRAGRGASKKNIENKIASIHEKIADPAYRAENRCSTFDENAP